MPQLANDVGAAYLADADQRDRTKAGDDLLRQFNQPEQPQTTEAQNYGGEPQSPTPQPKSGNLAVRAGKDIAKGVFVESGPAVYAGVHDALQNTYGALTDLGDWISSKTGFYGVHVGKEGVHLTTQQEYESEGKPGGSIDPAQAALTATKTGEPETVTGGLIKGVSQFVTGLALTKNAMGAFGVPAEMSGAAGYGLSAVKGAIANFAAFDPHQQRLSNLIERFPQLSNPVTQFLAAKPDDGEATGRFKNAMEGLGLGALADGFVRGVRLLRSISDARSAAQGTEEGALATAPAAKPALQPGALSGLGDESVAPGAPILQPTKAQGEALPTKPTSEQLTEAAKAGAPEQVPSTAAGNAMQPPKTYINFARIDAPEDIERAMQELADTHKADIDTATRGTQTFEQIKLNASQQDAWNVLKSRRIGDPLNAEQSVAARQLWGSSAAKLVQLAQEAVTSPNEANQFAFRKMLAIHNAIQQEVIGARTETARALASWRIPTGTPESRLQDLTNITHEAGGADVNTDLARRVVQLASSNTPDAELALSHLAEKSTYARTRDAVIQAFTDSLLSSPITQAKILSSNVSTALWRMGERYVGSRISGLLGDQAVQPGEASAMWSGWIGSFKDAMAYAGKAFRTGITKEGIGEPHQPYASNIGSEAFKLDPESTLGRVSDFIGSALSMGRRSIAAQHDMALTMAYRGELNAQAVRQAVGELNAGELQSEGFDSRVAELLANPSDEMQQTARTSAKYQAFLDEPGKIAQWLLDGRQQIPALRVIAPFIKIPARIMSYTFERSPLAPLMSDFRAKIAAGGATRDLALAQVAMGSMITSTAMDMTLNSRLKGGGPPEKGLEQAQEREGAMRDSLLVGDKWYNINGVHPIGKLMLLAADVAEAINGGQHELKNDADTEKLWAGTTLAIGRTMLDNSYMQGFSNLFATLHDARVGSAGESGLLSLAGSAVPSIVATADRGLDPYQREVYSLLDEYKSKIPGLSQTLSPRLNLWGYPIPNGHDPITNLISPVKMADVHHEPIDDEILRQQMNITLPSRNVTFKGEMGGEASIDMSHYPDAYSRYLQLAGHELKHPAWQMGAKDLLNAIVSGDHPLSAVYDMKSDGPDGGKEMMVREIMSQYRDLAKKQLLEEYPKLQSEVNDKAEARQALKMPVVQ